MKKLKIRTLAGIVDIISKLQERLNKTAQQSNDNEYNILSVSRELQTRTAAQAAITASLSMGVDKLKDSSEARYHNEKILIESIRRAHNDNDGLKKRVTELENKPVSVSLPAPQPSDLKPLTPANVSDYNFNLVIGLDLECLDEACRNKSLVKHYFGPGCRFHGTTY